MYEQNMIHFHSLQRLCDGSGGFPFTSLQVRFTFLPMHALAEWRYQSEQKLSQHNVHALITFEQTDREYVIANQVWALHPGTDDPRCAST
jgi:hypothetical protein